MSSGCVCDDVYLPPPLSEEADDDDDPEYNFLADTDEPDVEDYRNDRAVRITSKSPRQPGDKSCRRVFV